MLQSSSSPAADKNSVSPNTISLPSGPGSIEGLSEAFQPMLTPDLAFEIVMRRSKKLHRQGAKTILAEGALEYFDVKIILSSAACRTDFKRISRFIDNSSDWPDTQIFTISSPMSILNP